MKAIIFGLGNFGRSLAIKLTNLRHEVIGVDSKIDLVEDLKDHLTIAICLDSTDERAVSSLPLRDVDVAIVAIGENEGASQAAADDVDLVVYGTDGGVVAGCRHRRAFGPAVGLGIIFFYGAHRPMGSRGIESGFLGTRMHRSATDHIDLPVDRRRNR